MSIDDIERLPPVPPAPEASAKEPTVKYTVVAKGDEVPVNQHGGVYVAKAPGVVLQGKGPIYLSDADLYQLAAERGLIK